MGLLNGLLNLFGKKPKDKEKERKETKKGQKGTKPSVKEEEPKDQEKKEGEPRKVEKKEGKKKDRAALRHKRRSKKGQEAEGTKQKEKVRVEPKDSKNQKDKKLLANKADSVINKNDQAKKAPNIEDLVKEPQGHRIDLVKEEPDKDHGQKIKRSKDLGEEVKKPKEAKVDNKVKEEKPQKEAHEKKQDKEDKPKENVETEEQKAPSNASLAKDPNQKIQDSLARLEIGESLKLPAYGEVEDPRVEREDQTFYHFTFTYKGRTYNRARIHRDILQKHLEDYEKTKTLPLKSFKESNL